MAHMINNVSPFRLFDEILKIMHSGSAVTGYNKLKEFGLFKYLFQRMVLLKKLKKKKG